MSDLPSSDVELPTDLVHNLLRRHTSDPSATITDLSTTRIVLRPGAVKLYRTRLAWTGQDGPATADWVAKLWSPHSFTGLFMQVSQPLEALAWNAGLLTPDTMPDGMAVPYIGATVDGTGEGAWILMEDIAPAIETAQAWATNNERIRLAHLILERMAQWHALWEQPGRQAILDAHAWLISQEQRLQCGADVYAICLGQTPRRIKETTPAMRDAICPPTRAFAERLPSTVRPIWRELLYNRDALTEAFAGLPQTLLHGDLFPGQVGVDECDGRAQLLVLDWEWIGRGSAAFDVRQFVNSVAESGERRDVGAALPEYYFDCYRASGGTGMDREMWQRAYGLATIYEGVRAFPFIAGGSTDPGSLFHGWMDSDDIAAQIDEVSRAIDRWLRH